jgi:hypothetical protein
MDLEPRCSYALEGFARAGQICSKDKCPSFDCQAYSSLQLASRTALALVRASFSVGKVCGGATHALSTVQSSNRREFRTEIMIRDGRVDGAIPNLFTFRGLGCVSSVAVQRSLSPKVSCSN